MYISSAILQQFRAYWNSCPDDIAGPFCDLQFIARASWLQDSAVVDRIEATNGQWLIRLVFAHPALPETFIIRSIRLVPTEKAARLEAEYLKRTAAKDARGTVMVCRELFYTPEN